jgi:histidyl-tRNA synthetase
MTPVQPVRGTQSLLGEDADRLAAVVAAFDRVRRLYGFQRVEVPTIEQTGVFARTIGETTDVVSKEMYTFLDKGDRSISLRPEFTAGIARAYLSEGWQRFSPLRAATHGAVFRYEAPQAGRYRQFHQLDAEIIGAAEPQADVELLAFADQLLKELGVEGVVLKLNTLGDTQSRDAWRTALIEHFSAHAGELSEDSRERLQKNPLRILDSKDPRDRPFVEAAPVIKLSGQAEEFFSKVLDGLRAAGIDYELDPHLVRGLDYYRHTAFEFVTDRLGAQGAVIAGGRYDGLIEQLGGSPTPAVGWAAGIERLAMLIDRPVAADPMIAVIPDKPDLRDEAARIAAHLRRGGFVTVTYLTGNSKKQTDRARREGVDSILYVRDREQLPTSLHLSHSPNSAFDGTDLLLKALGSLPGEYGQLSGDDLK